MAGVSGIRGIVGEGMTPEVALLWASAFGTWLKGAKVVLSRDSRPTGKMLSYAVKSGLLSAGCDVEDIGIVPTPVGALAVERRGAGGGIIITASHNAQPWNALKFVRHDGRMITADEFVELEQIVNNGPIRSVGWEKIGTDVAWNESDVMYLGSVTGISGLDLPRIKKKGFTVAFDGVNGAGSFLYPKLLEMLGCKVVAIHSDGSGIFPHSPEPLPVNLGDLSKKVVEERCVVGFAVDPDGDRLAVIDENGRPIGEELTLALGVKSVLDSQPGPIVVNCLTSQVMDDLANQYGVTCHRTKVGEANVSSRMRDVHAVAGGEGNGGMILPEIHLVRDAGIGMVLILNLLSSTKKTVSQLIKELPQYYMIKASFPVGTYDPVELVERAAAMFPHETTSRIDGVRVSYPDGWIQMRPSNTEPILRIYSEATSMELAEQYQSDLSGKLKSILSKLDA
jgi:phosphomannomutase